MKYTRGAKVGRSILGKTTAGYAVDRLTAPSDIVFEYGSQSFIISDYQNRRVLRYREGGNAETLIDDIFCGGLAVDDEHFIYASDTENHVVRRYVAYSKVGTVVAGGNGQGSRLKQLNHPTYIFVGPDQAVYVSDAWNDRVVKWAQGAEKGIIIAGGNRKGKNLTQLNCPAGLIVDTLGTVYVADQKNHRVMRWYKDAATGQIIAGKPHGTGSGASEMNEPEALSFDSHGNLYVADSRNHRIQRFAIRTT
jgi:sugar lactone lactonase YvrE